jgi:hypothetical protein
VVKRLFAGRRRLTRLYQAELDAKQKYRDWPPGVPYPHDVSVAIRRSHREVHRMKVDLESLFLFGAILLDQWAHVVAYLSGLDRPENITFHPLAVEQLERKDAPEPIRALRIRFAPEMLWLDVQFRSYRNHFIVHAKRPWQRGTIADAVGGDFALHTPTPPGWDDDDQINQEIRRLTRLAPKWLLDARSDYWEKVRPRRLLERLVENIGHIQRRADRERVIALHDRCGLTTPSFDVLATALARFLRYATPAVVQIALRNSHLIKFGPPRPQLRSR